jgi:hypothetical protein
MRNLPGAALQGELLARLRAVVAHTAVRFDASTPVAASAAAASAGIRPPANRGERLPLRLVGKSL